MLKNLRRVHFPSDLQTSGPIIPARLLNHVADHAGIVRKAEETAERIREHAEQEARQIRETARERMAASMRRDLDSLKSLTQRKEENLLLNSSRICVQICTVVFDQMIEEMTTQQRIETLVNNLLKANHHGRSLLICSHPSQVDMVKNEVARVMANQLNLKNWTVQSRDDLAPFEVMISASNGSEIRVSLDNLKVLYREELNALARELEPLIHFDKDDNETFV